jgi:hypothetical protein
MVMSTTYTTNYHLGKQTDTSDTFDMSVITDNMDIIDTQMKSNENNIITTARIAEDAETKSNTALNVINYGPQKTDLDTSFEMGYVHNRYYSNKATSSNTAVSNLFTATGTVKVKIAKGYKIVVVLVDENMFCGRWQPAAWATDSYTITPDTPYFCFELRKTDESNFTIDTLPDDVIEASITIGAMIGSNRTCYVQATGSDTNNGVTRSTPFATIQKAINEGFKTIMVKEGIYTDGFVLQDMENVSIILDHYYDHFSPVTKENNPKIIIDGSADSLSTGVTIQRCTGCKIQNIEVKNVSDKGFLISKCSCLTITDCISHDCGVGATSGSVGGFVITDTDANFDNCVCYNIGTDTAGTGAHLFDGFNIHGTGTTNFYNCSAWNCEDDGISHHDACCGSISGGEWYNCGKGGISSPTHGAKVNISNAFCHNNKVGIYAKNTSQVTSPRGNIIISNCVCVNNNRHDFEIGDYYDVIAINCVYSTIDGAANVTRYGTN